MQGAKRIVPPSVANGSRVALRVIAAKFHLGKLLMGVVIVGLVAIGALAFLTEDLSVAAPTVALCAGGLLVISAPQRRPLTLRSVAAGFGVTGAVVSGWLWLLDSLSKLDDVGNLSLTINLALLAAQVILGVMAMGLVQSLWYENAWVRRLREKNERNRMIAAALHFIVTFTIIFGSSVILSEASYAALGLTHQISGLDIIFYVGIAIFLSGALRHDNKAPSPLIDY